MTTNKELPIDKNIHGHDYQKLNLSNFFEMCWRNKIIIISLVLFCIIMGFIFLINSKKYYHVSLKFTAIESNQNSINSSLGSGTSAFLESFVGSSSPTDKRIEQFKTNLTSTNVIKKIYNEEKTLVKIFESRWNNEKKEWMPRKSDFFSRSKNIVKKLLGLPIPKDQKPSIEELKKFVSYNLSATTNKKNGISTIEVFTPNKDLWFMLLPKLHSLSDEIMKEKDLIRTKKNIDVLVKTLNSTKQNDQRSALITTLSNQYKILMATSSPLPYVSEIFEDVYSSDAPVKPVPKRILIISIIIGISLGVLITLIKNVYNKKYKLLI